MAQESRLYDKENLYLPFHSTDTLLPDLHIAAQTAFMQIHPHMFTVRTGGVPETRSVQRTVSDSPKTAQMPSMGRKRL